MRKTYFNNGELVTALNPASRTATGESLGIPLSHQQSAYSHYFYPAFSTKKAHISLRKPFSHFWEVCLEKIANFLIRFVGFQLILKVSMLMSSMNSISQRVAFLSTDAKEVKACRRQFYSVPEPLV